jgi:hypothetical protein
LGFKGAEGWAGKKSGIYFSPRHAGFRVLAPSPRDATVAPFALGPRIRFSPRSILRKDTRIDPQIAHNARDAWRARPGARRREHLAWTRLLPRAIASRRRRPLTMISIARRCWSQAPAIMPTPAVIWRQRVDAEQRRLKGLGEFSSRSARVAKGKSRPVGERRI